PDLRQLDQRVSIRYDLEPLSPEETSAYVQHRLAVAGGGMAVTFVPKALARVHAFTGGVPRLINLLGDCSLLTPDSSHGTPVVPKRIESAARSLELERPRRGLRGWMRQRVAPFAAGVLLAAMVGGGAAAMWHYREYATALVQRVASRQ